MEEPHVTPTDMTCVNKELGVRPCFEEYGEIDGYGLGILCVCIAFVCDAAYRICFKIWGLDGISLLHVNTCNASHQRHAAATELQGTAATCNSMFDRHGDLVNVRAPEVLNGYGF